MSTMSISPPQPRSCPSSIWARLRSWMPRLPLRRRRSSLGALITRASRYAAVAGAADLAAMIAEHGSDPELVDEFMESVALAAVLAIEGEADFLNEYYLMVLGLKLLRGEGEETLFDALDPENAELTVTKFIGEMVTASYLAEAGYDGDLDPYAVERKHNRADRRCHQQRRKRRSRRSA